MTRQLIGHQVQVEMFERAIARGRLGHAYLFTGPPGIGKRRFAETLAQGVLCGAESDQKLAPCGECSGCRQVMAGTHPDLFRVGLPEGKSELPIETFVGPPEKRGRAGLCHDLSLTAMHGGYRIAIIDDADKMNVASANALLKTLEEPGPKSLLILIATDADQVINTIRSRCQLIYFGRLTVDQVAGVVSELATEIGGDSFSQEQIQTVADRSDGSAGKAWKELQRAVEENQDVNEIFRKILSKSKPTALTLNKAAEPIMSAAGSDTGSQREAAIQIITACMHYYHCSLTDFQLQDLQVSDQFGRCLDRCFEAYNHVERKVSVPALMDHFYQDLELLMRPAWKNPPVRS